MRTIAGQLEWQYALKHLLRLAYDARFPRPIKRDNRVVYAFKVVKIAPFVVQDVLYRYTVRET